MIRLLDGFVLRRGRLALEALRGKREDFVERWLCRGTGYCWWHLVCLTLSHTLSLSLSLSPSEPDSWIAPVIIWCC